jgi:hypothetical protein
MSSMSGRFGEVGGVGRAFSNIGIVDIAKRQVSLATAANSFGCMEPRQDVRSCFDTSSVIRPWILSRRGCDIIYHLLENQDHNIGF